MIDKLITQEFFYIFLVFLRLGTAMAFMPGFSEHYIPVPIRLAISLMISAIVAQPLRPYLPPMPSDLLVTFLIIFKEVFIGFFLGILVRIIIDSLDSAGTIISNQTGLGTAQIFNPGLAQQGVVIGALLTLLGLFMIFVTDLHFVFLRGVVASYDLFKVGEMPPTGDFLQMVVKMVSESFVIAMELSAPFILVGVILNVAMAFIAKLVPSINIFFVALPLQVVLGLVILAVVLPGLMVWFMERVGQDLTILIPQAHG